MTNQTSLALMSTLGSLGLLTVLRGVALVEPRHDVVRERVGLAELGAAQTVAATSSVITAALTAAAADGPT